MILDPCKETLGPQLAKVLSHVVSDSEVDHFRTSQHPDKLLKIEPKQGKKESDGKLHVEYDWSFLEAQLKRMGKNMIRYAEGNWKKEMNVDELKKALFRHVLCVMSDNFEDDGDALGHLVAIALNSMFIHHQMLKNN